MAEPVRIALLGCGNVGAQVVRLLSEHGDDLTARVGRPLELAGVAVRDATTARPGVPAHLLTCSFDHSFRFWYSSRVMGW